MRFLADQDVYQITVDFIRSLGHDVLRAGDVGLGRASDEELVHHAYLEQRILVTRDKGFGALLFLSHLDNFGIVLLRITPQTINSIHEELARFLKERGDTNLQNYFVVIEPGSHRVRILK